MKIPKRFGICCGVVAALLGLVGLVAFYLVADGPPPDLSDLEVTRRVVALAHNGFLLVDLTEDDFQRDDSVLSIDPFGSDEDAWDPAKVRELLERNGAVLGLLDQCLDKPDFQVRQSETWRDYDYIIAWKTLAELLRQRAALELVDGHVDAAFQIVEFGHRVENAQGMRMTFAFGAAVKSIGLTVLTRIVSRGDLDVGKLKTVIDRLDGFPVRSEALADTFREAFQLAMRSFEALEARTGSLESLLLRPNDTVSALAEAFRIAIANISLRHPQRRRLPRELSNIEDGMGNSLGRRFLTNWLEDGRTLILEMDETRFSLNVTRAAIALRCHVLEYDRLPERLDELVPSYLKTVPVDPLDGRPVRYSRERRTLYSGYVEGLDDPGHLDEWFTHELDPEIVNVRDR